MNKGFTLIELLIVITLFGLAIALVGPLTIEQVESARAREEQQKLQRWLRQQSFNAFATEQTLLFTFEGKALYQVLANGQTPDRIVQFEYLFFEPQQLSFNANGITTTENLTFFLKGRPVTLSLTNTMDRANAR